MEILIKAKELGEMILRSEEAKRLELANAIYMADADAQKAVQEYNELQSKLHKISRKMSKEEISSAEAELSSFKASVEAHPVIKESIEAQKSFNDLVNQVIDVINFSLKKDSFKTTSKEGCGSGGCGGCGS